MIADDGTQVANAVSSVAFREIMGSFPTGVTIITTESEDGKPLGLTANAVSSVSLNPPQLLICLGKQRYTAQAIRERGAFVVNFLSRQQQSVAERFASPAKDKFAGVQVARGEHGLPIIRGALAHAECVVQKVLEAGDHLIIVGAVLRGDARNGVPLMFFRREYGEWPGAAPSPETAE